ncbi:MAG: helix-turn-helix transcriptional regulator [bacterium]|nr:helix-turn-helix transcriptional regulator [bacterium]
MQLFAKRVSQLMDEQSVSTRMLAENLNLSYSALNNYLHARRWPDLATLRQIACQLHTSTDYLLGLCDIPYDNQLTEAEWQLVVSLRTNTPLE